MRSPQRITSKELLSNGKVITSTSPTSTSVQTSRQPRPRRVPFDPDDRAAALDERTCEVPARASDVEHPLSRPDEIEEPSMAAEGTGVQLDVAGRVGRGQRLYAGAAGRIVSARHGQEREEEGAENDLDPEPEAGQEQRRLVRPAERAEAVRGPLDANCGQTGNGEKDEQDAPTMPCSSLRRRERRSSRWSRSPMRTRAYVRAKTPSWITWAPISVRATKPSMVWICHVRPKMSIGPAARTTMPMIPRRSMRLPEPGRANSGCTGA